MPTATFEEFDKRARAGAHLNVVFFGASLTWGANASDPQRTSYRADMANKLAANYPQAHFKFFDAAIGGTNSQLGVFRLQRDVLSYHPDLVFLDFSANDDITTDDAETLSSYESLMRRLISEGKCPVVPVIFPFAWNIGSSELPRLKRRNAHLALARAYNLPVGDVIALITRRVESGQASIKTLWPIDSIHPGDEGYATFAETVWNAFQLGVIHKMAPRIPPKMLYAPTYMTWQRARISGLGPLPVGWMVGRPNRISAYYDFLMSRWLDDEVVASNRASTTDAQGQNHSVPQQVAPLKFTFRAETVMLLGETTLQTGKYRVSIDGKLVQRVQDGKTLTEYDPGAFAKTINGNGHHVQLIATGLSPHVAHTLEIEPILSPDTPQELRLESICVAGGDATVTPATTPTKAAPTTAATP